MCDNFYSELSQFLSELCKVCGFSNGAFVLIVHDRLFPADFFVLIVLGEDGGLCGGGGCVDVYWFVKDFHPKKDIAELGMHGELEVGCSIG